MFEMSLLAGYAFPVRPNALLLHILPAAELRHLDRYGLIGDGAAVVELRAAIRAWCARSSPTPSRGIDNQKSQE
jgi:hypothetical protein